MRKISGREILVLESYTKHGYDSTQLHILDDGLCTRVEISSNDLHEFNCSLRNDTLIFCNKKDADTFMKLIPDNEFYVHYYYSADKKVFNVDRYVRLFNVLLHIIELGFASSIAWLIFCFLN